MMEEALGSGVVRVATLNLWGRNGAWDGRRSILVDGLRELQPTRPAAKPRVRDSLLRAAGR